MTGGDRAFDQKIAYGCKGSTAGAYARHWPTGLAREADGQVGDGGHVSHARHAVAPAQHRDLARSWYWRTQRTFRQS